jgi:hypothetical protein
MVSKNWLNKKKEAERERTKKNSYRETKNRDRKNSNRDREIIGENKNGFEGTTNIKEKCE